MLQAWHKLLEDPCLKYIFEDINLIITCELWWLIVMMADNIRLKFNLIVMNYDGYWLIS